MSDPTTTPDHRALVHDLRMRVLAGDDPSPEEFLLIVEDIRRGRRSADRPQRPAKGSKLKTGAPLPPADLKGLMDQDIS